MIENRKSASQPESSPSRTVIVEGKTGGVLEEGVLHLTQTGFTWTSKDNRATRQHSFEDVRHVDVSSWPRSVATWALLLWGAIIAAIGPAMVVYVIFVEYPHQPHWPEFGRCLAWLLFGSLTVMGLVILRVVVRSHLVVVTQSGETHEYYVPNAAEFRERYSQAILQRPNPHA